MKPQMLGTALVEDLNRLACAQEQDRFARDPARARESLRRLRHLDLTELPRFQREGWLDRDEVDRLARFARFAAERLTPIPDGVDPVRFTRADPGWQSVREQALEIVAAFDAFVDLGIPGWGRPHVPGPE